MKFDEKALKAQWQSDVPTYDEDIQLKKVLSNTAKQTAMKDIMALFVGWIWVVFLGVGASVYSANRKLKLRNNEYK